MGNLKPNKTIIYETPDNGKTIYGRYQGETERFIVGEHFDNCDFIKTELEIWKNILLSAKTDTELQKELDKIKTLYYLKQKEKPIMWHPV